MADSTQHDPERRRYPRIRAKVPVELLQRVNGMQLRAMPGLDGRFALCATKNIFSFLLLDQEDGRTWIVQWNPDDKKRRISPL